MREKQKPCRPAVTATYRVENREIVGAPGFEPGASCTPCKRASQTAPRPVCDVSLIVATECPHVKRKSIPPGCSHRIGRGEVGRGWRRPTLPGGYPPSTIGAGGLNCRVREGTGCTPTAGVTNHLARPQVSPRRLLCIGITPDHPLLRTTWISPRPLVPVGSTCCQAYTPGLFSSSSPSGLTWLPSEEAHLEASFPLRCFQRLSAPKVATRHCHGRDNRHTSASSTPVLSY